MFANERLRNPCDREDLDRQCCWALNLLYTLTYYHNSDGTPITVRLCVTRRNLLRYCTEKVLVGISSEPENWLILELEQKWFQF